MLASWRVCLIAFPEMILPHVSFIASQRVGRWMLLHFLRANVYGHIMCGICIFIYIYLQYNHYPTESSWSWKKTANQPSCHKMRRCLPSKKSPTVQGSPVILGFFFVPKTNERSFGNPNAGVLTRFRLLWPAMQPWREAIGEVNEEWGSDPSSFKSSFQKERISSLNEWVEDPKRLELTLRLFNTQDVDWFCCCYFDDEVLKNWKMNDVLKPHWWLDTLFWWPLELS